MLNKICTPTLAFCISFVTIPAFAESSEPTPEQKQYAHRLTGNWGGVRSSWEEAGFAVDIIYKLDVMGNASGGIRKGVRGLDNLDAVFTLDGEKIAGAKGLAATIHLLNNFGGKPDAALAGSSQGIDNIEVPRATGKLYQAFLEQNLFHDGLSILAGLYDLNSEFYVTDSSALFIHSAFGIGTDMGQSGQNGPSIFPFTSVGARVRVQPAEAIYFQVAVLDGVPGDVDHLRGTHINFDENDGLLIAGETGYAPAAGKIAVGGWHYTEKFEQLTLTGAKQHSQGAYILAETPLYEESADQGLTAFARFGIAGGDVNQFDYAWVAGLVYTGLFPGRDEGQSGFGVTRAHNGHAYRKASLIAGLPADTAETTFELTYSDKILPWMSVQPDVQYLINPGTDSQLDNALVVGARLTVEF